MLYNMFSEPESSLYLSDPDLFVAKDPHYSSKKKRTRLLVQKGVENILLRADDIVLFYTDSKIVYVIDQFGKKYLVEGNLAQLENELDPLTFFRANRQYIISLNFIKSFRAYEKVKIKVDVVIPESDHFIIISQETAPYFRRWMDEA